MPVGTDYQPVATATGANVDPQGTFLGSSYQQVGFTVGVAQPNQANKVWRQSSMWAAAWGLLVSQLTNIFIADDGNVANLITNILAALRLGSLKLLVIAFSPTAVFDASQGTDFEMTLTGNLTGPTLVNVTAGQELTFIFHQDGTGNRTITNPSNLPLSTIDPGANKTSVQQFKVSNSLALYPVSAMTVT